LGFNWALVKFPISTLSYWVGPLTFPLELFRRFREPRICGPIWGAIGNLCFPKEPQTWALFTLLLLERAKGKWVVQVPDFLGPYPLTFSLGFLANQFLGTGLIFLGFWLTDLDLVPGFGLLESWAWPEFGGTLTFLTTKGPVFKGFLPGNSLGPKGETPRVWGLFDRGCWKGNLRAGVLQLFYRLVPVFLGKTSFFGRGKFYLFLPWGFVAPRVSPLKLRF